MNILLLIALGYVGLRCLPQLLTIAFVVIKTAWTLLMSVPNLIHDLLIHPIESLAKQYKHRLGEQGQDRTILSDLKNLGFIIRTTIVSMIFYRNDDYYRGLIIPVNFDPKLEIKEELAQYHHKYPGFSLFYDKKEKGYLVSTDFTNRYPIFNLVILGLVHPLLTVGSGISEVVQEVGSIGSQLYTDATAISRWGRGDNHFDGRSLVRDQPQKQQNGIGNNKNTRDLNSPHNHGMNVNNADSIRKCNTL
jgi:hypothetical protein